jgi:hypothetical protein
VKKLLFIGLALVLGLSVALAGCTEPVPPDLCPESILVGLARDLDGPLGVFECGYGGAVYRWFADKVNDAGGVHLSDYDTDTEDCMVPIELKVRDFDVITWDLAAVTTALIDTDEVDFVWGGPGTDCIFTQAPICNAKATILITLEGGASSMIWDADIDVWPYVWVTLSFSNWYQIPVLYDMLDAELETDPVAYITYIGGLGSTHGIEYRDETETEFGAENIIDAGFHSYELTNEEATAVILAAETAYNATPYDIFCAYTYPWNVFTLTGALLGSNFDPPAILFGPGGNSNIFPVLFGPNVENMLSFIVADNQTSTAISDVYGELAAQCELDWDDPDLTCDQGAQTSGWDSLDYWGMPCYVAGLEMWQAAVEAAGNINAVDVRDAIAAFDDENPADTVLGDCWFTVFGVGGTGGGILAYECHPGEIGQWQGGKYVVVGGNAPTEDFVYPYHAWPWLA